MTSAPPPRRDAAVPAGILTGTLGWTWQPLAGGGVEHLVPPRPGPLSTTACWRPLRREAPLQPALALPHLGGMHGRCTACLAHNGGVES